MCLYDYDFEKHMELERKEWKEIGVKEGVEQGIENLIYTLHSMHHSYSETSQALTARYKLTEEQAGDFMKKHWPL